MWPATQGDLYTKYVNVFVTAFIALVASGRATDWPDGILHRHGVIHVYGGHSLTVAN
jgi:hypothetical protein